MLNSLLKTLSLTFLFQLGIMISARAQGVEFEMLYQSALKNSTSLAKTRAEAEEARATFKASESAFMPRLGVESRYESFDSSFEKTRGGTSNAFLEWNIFNGFKDLQARRSLSALAEAAEIDKERTESNFKWISMAKYVQAQAKLEAVEIYKGVIASNLKNLETVKLRRSSGRLSEADFIEFELFDSKLKQELMAKETDAAAAIAELEAFSGLSPISKLPSVLEPKKLDLDKVNLQELLASSKSRLRNESLKVESAEARKSLASGGYLPTIDLKGTYGSTGLRDTEVSPETAVGVVARWELFSGFETVNNRRVNEAQLTKIKAEFENNRIQFLSRAEQLRNQLKSILSRLEFEERNEKNIEKYLKTVQEEYRRGAKSSNDLKSALQLALETQLNRLNLHSDYFEARAELQEIIGTELREN